MLLYCLLFCCCHKYTMTKINFHEKGEFVVAYSSTVRVHNGKEGIAWLPRQERWLITFFKYIQTVESDTESGDNYKPSRPTPSYVSASSSKTPSCKDFIFSPNITTDWDQLFKYRNLWRIFFTQTTTAFVSLLTSDDSRYYLTNYYLGPSPCNSLQLVLYEDTPLDLRHLTLMG